MSRLLSRFLKKRGIDSVDRLTPEEHATYRAWQAALRGRKIADEDVTRFFDQELAAVLAKLPDARLDTREDAFLKVKLEFLQKVREFLAAPERERRAAEAALAQSLE